jgi:hypothetical protein
LAGQGSSLEELDQNILAILGDRPRRSPRHFLPSWKVGSFAAGMILVTLLAAFLISSKGVRWFTGDDGTSSTLFLKIPPPPSASPMQAPILASPAEGEDGGARLADAAEGARISSAQPQSPDQTHDTGHIRAIGSRRYEKRRAVPVRRQVSYPAAERHPRLPRGPRSLTVASAPAVMSPQPPTKVAAPAPTPAPSAVATRSGSADQHRSALEAYRKQVAETQAALAAYDSDRSAYRDELARTQRTQQEYGKKPHSDR